MTATAQRRPRLLAALCIDGCTPTPRGTSPEHPGPTQATLHDHLCRTASADDSAGFVHTQPGGLGSGGHEGTPHPGVPTAVTLLCHNPQPRPCRPAALPWGCLRSSRKPTVSSPAAQGRSKAGASPALFLAQAQQARLLCQLPEPAPCTCGSRAPELKRRGTNIHMFSRGLTYTLWRQLPRKTHTSAAPGPGRATARQSPGHIRAPPRAAPSPAEHRLQYLNQTPCILFLLLTRRNPVGWPGSARAASCLPREPLPCVLRERCGERGSAGAAPCGRAAGGGGGRGPGGELRLGQSPA